MNSSVGVVEAPTRQLWIALSLLWLSGMGLRLTLLAVPPVIPLIHAELGLSETEIGTLGTLPSLLLAAAAIPGSLLIARFGATAALVTGLLFVGFGSAARGAADDIVALYLTTMITSAGVAIMQPAMPPLVRAWVPSRVPFATALYTNGLLVGETLAVALTLPFVLPLAGGSWRMSFVLWGVPVIATAILVMVFAPRSMAPGTSAPRRWWPNWRDKQLWRLALCLGGINTCYFGTNTFLPDYLHALGRADLISPTLTALNFSQLPASFLMLWLAPLLVRKHWAYAGIGFLNLLCVIGIVVSSNEWIMLWAGLLGFFGAVGLVLLLALPPLLSAPEDVHRMASAMFTISYPCAVLMSIIGGYAWDVTRTPWVAFAPIGFSALMLALLSLRIEFRSEVALQSAA